MRAARRILAASTGDVRTVWVACRAANVTPTAVSIIGRVIPVACLGGGETTKHPLGADTAQPLGEDPLISQLLTRSSRR